MGMTKQMKFVLAVQTYALVKELRCGADIAGSVVAAACELDVKDIPEKFNIGFSASQYVDYQYGTRNPSTGNPAKKPEWLDAAVMRR